MTNEDIKKKLRSNVKDVKKKFRNKVKQATLDYLLEQKANIGRKIAANKDAAQRIMNEQRILKKEYSELYRMIGEYIK